MAFSSTVKVAFLAPSLRAHILAAKDNLSKILSLLTKYCNDGGITANDGGITHVAWVGSVKGTELKIDFGCKNADDWEAYKVRLGIH